MLEEETEQRQSQRQSNEGQFLLPVSSFSCTNASVRTSISTKGYQTEAGFPQLCLLNERKQPCNRGPGIPWANEIAIGIGTLLQDGLGDTIQVSLTEPPEEEIDPCRRLANLGMQAAKLEKGVAPFEEKHHHYFNFQRRTSQLPIQKEGDRLQAHNPSCSSQKTAV
ncbi:hypothetical protein SUGI_0969730 [Cryptomeria japonica]|nr:hypothetical protein SUGI_0969730 [Cryptomeria japonica]